MKYEPAAKDQSYNKDAFRENYGVEIKLPSVYVLEAKIFPIDPNYIIKVVQYAIPKNDKKVITYPYTSEKSGHNKEVREETMAEIHKERKYKDEWCSV